MDKNNPDIQALKIEAKDFYQGKLMRHDILRALSVLERDISDLEYELEHKKFRRDHINILLSSMGDMDD